MIEAVDRSEELDGARVAVDDFEPLSLTHRR